MTVTRKFPKEKLKSLAYGEKVEGLMLVADFHLSNKRWTELRQMVFSVKGEFGCWSVPYEIGLTETQDTRPFDWEKEEVEAVKVAPHEKTVAEYLEVE